MADEIKVGMMGTSGYSQILHLPCLKSHPRAKVVAICGRNQERAQEVAKQFDIPNVYSDYREMIDEAGIEAVVIATPNNLHYSMIMDALDARLHVLCEKPLALDLRQAKEVCEKADAAGVKHMIFFNLRWNPDYRYFRELIDDGYVGRLFHSHLHWVIGENLNRDQYHWRADKASNNGALWGYCSAIIDLALLCFGDIKKVTASLAAFKPPPPPEGREYEPSDDSAVLSVQFENGAHGTLYASKVVHLGRHHLSISASGEKGRLESTLWEVTGEIKPEMVGAQIDENEVNKLEVPDRFWEGVDRSKSQLEQYVELFKTHPIGDRLFIDSIYENKVVSPNFHDCLKVQRVIDAAMEADRTEKWVSV